MSNFVASVSPADRPRRFEAATAPVQQIPPPFDHLKKPGFFKSLFLQFAVTPPRVLLWAAREFPIPPLRFTFASRYDEVTEILNRPDVFGVPFGSEMARLNDGKAPGTKFILGNDDRGEHDEQLLLVMQAFPRADIGTKVAPMAFRIATECLRDAGPTFDAVKDLITKVALQICVQYYGVPIGDDPQKFAYATFTTSGHLFGKPPIEGTKADAAADYFRHFVDRAIREEEQRANHSDTVLGRMVARRKGTKGSLSDQDFKEIRAFLVGMIIGFVPTNTMAAGHILEVLLDHPKWLDQACSAANAGDDALLERVLFEALRFMPINPGPFRICQKNYVLAEGTPRARLIKEGSTVWVLTFAAMFDPRRIAKPADFVPSRPQSDHLHFGFGMHSCAGLMIARAQITQTFKALLRGRTGLKRVSPLRLRSAMPIGLDVTRKGMT